ncbi:piwi-like protein 1 [Leptotrombidium deliense]|uniref:Piwi-like protein 1 n=1 Tax=Leptotrombidium deliense TaxID=299467 RepID=A0A443SLL0_9ACAR|nr:piwi-like protein 1 [Leptotrombidium deliense]
MSKEGAGRARGFGARGRSSQLQVQQPNLGNPASSPDSSSNDGSASDNDIPTNEAAMRGRGGYHAPSLVTKPLSVQNTVGEGGTTVTVLTNYFKLSFPESVIIHQYHVDFEPDIESAKMRRAMIMDHKETLQASFIFDGQSNIKSTTLLEGTTELMSSRRTDNEPIKITVKHTGEISWNHPEMMRMYNTQMRRNLQHLKYLLIGRHFFDPSMRQMIPEHKLQLWQGLLTAINRHDGGILMVCDTVFKVVRTDTVYEILMDMLRRDRNNFKDNARRDLAGTIVMTSYNNRTYKIDDIAFDKSPMFEFERRHGTTTIKDYYKEQYNINIRDDKQPLLQCLPSARDQRAGMTNPIFLVPELCSMTGLTDTLKSNFDLKKRLTQLTQADPNRRLQNLHGFMNTVSRNEDVRKEMQSWGLKFDNTVVALPARVLPSERILMNGDRDNQGATYNQQTGDFSKEIRGKPMKSPINLNSWGILVSGRDKNLVDDFAQTLNRVCHPMGVQLNRPAVKVLDNDRTQTFVEACKGVPSTFKMVVIIVPNNNKDRYDSIKKIFCISHPIPSQVIVSRTISKKQMLMSVCTKIGIQMAVKLGAEVWYLTIPPNNLMVVGYDTYHDSAKRGVSVGGFVCSLTRTLTRWYSRVGFHNNREEMSSNFAVNFANGLKHYHQVNGTLPQRVVVYRDGVSEGQIPHVFSYETKQLKDTIKKVAGTQKIDLAFVIVTKRVNGRFFLKQGERQFANPIPGTVVDTVVTRPERYDFYLISQSVRQGTVSPTMYNIIEDETNWKPIHHQQLAYKLCHLYYNWQGTISVPVPCQYAHKLAYLTGTSLHQEPNPHLASLLFYLMSEENKGRSRGYGGRGRGSVQVRPGGDSPNDGSSSSSDNEGVGSGAVMRGRGGFTKTRPENIRSKVGEGGTIVPLLTNYFKLFTPENVIVHQYRVDFEPNIESPKMRRAMIMDHKERFNTCFIFDGQSDIKSTEYLEGINEFMSVRRTDNQPIRIIVRHTGEIGWGEQEMLRMFNTQMRRNLRHLKYLLIGRHLFQPSSRVNIPEHKLQLWQGLLTAVNRHDGGLLMVCDTVFKVIRSDTVYDMLMSILQRDRNTFKENARREISGNIVMTSYNNKTYRIDDIDFEKNPLYEFERRHGVISIKDYYKEQYNITIRDEKQPLLQCLPSTRDQRAGITKPIYLVPELCQMTGLSESLRNNFEIRKRLTTSTQADPNVRLQNLHQFMGNLKQNENVRQEMQSWGLKFDDSVTKISGRVLPPEKICTSIGEFAYDQSSGDFSKAIRGKKMTNPSDFSNWGILVSTRDHHLVDDFASMLNRVCQPMGIHMNRPSTKVLDNDRTATFVEACKAVPPAFKVVVIIVPNNNKDRYDAIKKVLCISHAIPSQVIVSRTISKKNMLMSVCTKIGIQMAVKIGAEPWHLTIPPNDLMIVGFDTYHDSARRNYSYGGFVCTLNRNLTRWYSRVTLHKDREEMSSHFAVNLTNGLKQYFQLNGKLPQRLVVYRDGVSEGQIQHVYECELKKLKNEIMKAARIQKIELAFVIVTKRVNARFFLRQGERQYGNPISGTVVDTVVTRPERYDFYLISQSVRQGTVSPTMYNIIEDQTNWKPVHHQQMAYKLCHLYYNWQGTISVPAPCQYAHKLAYLTGTSLHQEPNVSMSNTLFYL